MHPALSHLQALATPELQQGRSLSRSVPWACDPCPGISRLALQAPMPVHTFPDQQLGGGCRHSSPLCPQAHRCVAACVATELVQRGGMLPLSFCKALEPAARPGPPRSPPADSSAGAHTCRGSLGKPLCFTCRRGQRQCCSAGPAAMLSEHRACTKSSCWRPVPSPAPLCLAGALLWPGLRGGEGLGAMGQAGVPRTPRPSSGLWSWRAVPGVAPRPGWAGDTAPCPVPFPPAWAGLAAPLQQLQEQPETLGCQEGREPHRSCPCLREPLAVPKAQGQAGQGSARAPGQGQGILHPGRWEHKELEPTPACPRRHPAPAMSPHCRLTLPCNSRGAACTTAWSPCPGQRHDHASSPRHLAPRVAPDPGLLPRGATALQTPGSCWAETPPSPPLLCPRSTE